MLRYLLAGGSAAAVAGGLMLTAGAASGITAAPRPAVHPAAHHRSAAFVAEARAALVRYLRDNHPTVMLVHAGQPLSTLKSGTTTTTSYNWSGYADVSTTKPAFSRVSGTWTTPTVTCTNEDTITSEWVGLDGWTGSSIEQDGTLGWCFQGTPTYFTWYEISTSGTVEVGSALQPGDVINASVTRSATIFTLAVTDVTHPANSFTQTASCSVACPGSSAEWIAERPSFPIGIAPLADYSSWTLSNAQETFRGTPGTISSYPISYKINMEDATNSYFLSTPSALTGGNSFTTTWLNSY
jgi:hypothetical protein